MFISRTTGYSPTVPAEGHLEMLPRLWASDGSAQGVVFSHQSFSAPAECAILRSTGQENIRRILTSVVDDIERPMLAPNLAGDHWANDASIARMAEAKTYLQGTMGAAAGKIAIIGYSMGGALALAYARANLTLVSCLVLFQPVSSLYDMWANIEDGDTVVNAAYGGAYVPATHGPTHDPGVFGAQLAGLPIYIWYCTDDTIVTPSTVEDLADLIGSSVTLEASTGGHGDPGLDDVDEYEITSFLLEHTT